MVEDVEDGLAQRLRPVDADQDRPGHIQPRSRRPVSRSVTTVAFSVAPSTSAGGALTPSPSVPSAAIQTDSPRCAPSIVSAARSNPVRSAASGSAGAVSVAATNFRDTADLLVDLAE